MQGALNPNEQHSGLANPLMTLQSLGQAQRGAAGNLPQALAPSGNQPAINPAQAVGGQVMPLQELYNFIITQGRRVHYRRRECDVGPKLKKM